MSPFECIGSIVFCAAIVAMVILTRVNNLESENKRLREALELDPDQWKAFVAALDRPLQVKPRLTRLLSEPSVLEQQQKNLEAAKNWPVEVINGYLTLHPDGDCGKLLRCVLAEIQRKEEGE